MNWMILPFKRYAEFSGRSRRMEYWMFALLNFIVLFGILILMLGTGGAMGQLADLEAGEPSGLGALFSGFGLVFLAYALIVFIPSIAVSIRRLHDRDMSGWWYLGFVVGGLIPYIGFIISIAFIVIMALPGTEGPNRFGPDPKNPTSADVFA